MLGFFSDSYDFLHEIGSVDRMRRFKIWGEKRSCEIVMGVEQSWHEANMPWFRGSTEGPLKSSLVAQLVKSPPGNAGDLGSIPRLARSPGKGKSYPLQYSGLENSLDYTVHGVAKSWTRLSDFHFSNVQGNTGLMSFRTISSVFPQPVPAVWAQQSKQRISNWVFRFDVFQDMFLKEHGI